jgi:hypothetical protein
MGYTVKSASTGKADLILCKTKLALALFPVWTGTPAAIAETCLALSRSFGRAFVLFSPPNGKDLARILCEIDGLRRAEGASRDKDEVPTLISSSSTTTTTTAATPVRSSAPVVVPVFSVNDTAEVIASLDRAHQELHAGAVTASMLLRGEHTLVDREAIGQLVAQLPGLDEQKVAAWKAKGSRRFTVAQAIAAELAENLELQAFLENDHAKI